jgi:restriction endonuclease
MKLDSFRSRRPIDVIAKTNPILIIDPAGTHRLLPGECWKHPCSIVGYSADGGEILMIAHHS